jgi:ABC-2 type transport system ATP-binding protein
LIDHGRTVAAGTPSDLKARIGDQRVDVVAVNSVGLEGLVAALSSRFEINVVAERRTVSVPAPNEIGDLAEVSAAVQASGIPIDEIALRRPTLDDAFLALTGQPADSGDADAATSDERTLAGVAS